MDRCADLTTNALETFEPCVDITIRERRAFKETMHLSQKELYPSVSKDYKEEKPIAPVSSATQVETVTPIVAAKDTNITISMPKPIEFAHNVTAAPV